MDNEYGKSKLEAESILNRLQSENGNPVLFFVYQTYLENGVYLITIL
ncbi:hypothetical protein LEP1GSC110_4511 [Leptospira interrogans serovar Medanensis str. UT053]|nr:hypothetical protein LEP1GSC110_4511 [Leptospira interrogans serovar Medanensis str. UT053]